MKYGVIGTGWITESFVRSADTVPGMELVAVCSRSEESGQAFAARVGRSLTCYTTPEAMAESAIDGVYIASPNVLHYGQSRLFLEHGKHVLCEKPAVTGADQMRALLALAKSKGLVYMEALMMLYLPQRRTIQELIETIGPVRLCHVSFAQYSSKYPAYLRGETPNIFNPKLATGGLMDLGVYCVYPILDWFGRPERIQAAASFLRTGADHSGGAVFTYPDKIVTMEYSKTAQGYAGTELIGEKGTIRIDSISRYTGIHLHQAEDQLVFGEADRTDRMAGEARAFYERVTGQSTQPEEEKELMLLVAETMEEIRRQAGIEFPENKA